MIVNLGEAQRSVTSHADTKVPSWKAWRRGRGREEKGREGEKRGGREGKKEGGQDRKPKDELECI